MNDDAVPIYYAMIDQMTLGTLPPYPHHYALMYGHSRHTHRHRRLSPHRRWDRHIAAFFPCECLCLSYWGMGRLPGHEFLQNEFGDIAKPTVGWHIGT